MNSHSSANMMLHKKPRKIGTIVIVSMLLGLIIALVLILGIFAGDIEPVITGSALIGFALGWLALALLSIRFTDQPQKWAFIPAAYMGLIGLALVLFKPGNNFLSNSGWVWPIALVVLVVWMVRKSKQDLHSRTRKWILYPIFILLLITAIGGFFQKVHETTTKNDLAMAGKLVDVGGYRMHITCVGTGSPTVVLEPGLGEPSSAMTGWIAPAVSKNTRVCAYDRAGRGWSESAPKPQDGIQVARTLHTLLQNAHEKGPYVLAGHSAGGAYVLNFAAQYPNEVAGLALLDSMSPYQYEKIPSWPAFYTGFRRVSAIFPTLARVGFGQLAYGSAYSSYPSPAREEERTFWATPSLQRSQRDEFSVIRTSLKQAQALKSIGGKPLYVLTAVKDALGGWLPVQKELTTLSTDSVQELVQGADHDALVSSKQYAAQSSNAILKVVSAVRESKKLNTNQ